MTYCVQCTHCEHFALTMAEVVKHRCFDGIPLWHSALIQTSEPAKPTIDPAHWVIEYSWQGDHHTYRQTMSVDIITGTAEQAIDLWRQSPATQQLHDAHIHTVRKVTGPMSERLIIDPDIRP